MMSDNTDINYDDAELDFICSFCGERLKSTMDQVGAVKVGVFSGKHKLGIHRDQILVHLECLPNYIQGLYAELEVLHRQSL